MSYYHDFIPSLDTQSCIRRPLCSTLKLENLRSPKKMSFFMFLQSKKIPIPIKKGIMQLFSPDSIVFSKKKIDPENMKNPPSKVAKQKQKSRTTKSPLKMQDWVFRLELYLNFIMIVSKFVQVN